MLEDGDYLGRQNPGRGQASLGPRSIVLRFLRESKVGKLKFSTLRNMFFTFPEPDKFL